MQSEGIPLGICWKGRGSAGVCVCMWEGTKIKKKTKSQQKTQGSTDDTEKSIL